MFLKYILVALTAFILGSGITYFILNKNLDKEKYTRRELARICGNALDASQGISNTCGAAYNTLVGCLENQTCILSEFERLNNEKKQFEEKLDIEYKNIHLLQKNWSKEN